MQVCRLNLNGKLDRQRLDAALEDVSGTLSEGCGLLVDCLEMTAYESEARDRFVEWNRVHRSMLARVAIVTDKPLWRMVASTIALATRQDMKVFSDPAEAETWLKEA